jgi:hypothetical protein
MDSYNSHTSEVDGFDQTKQYYSTQQVKHRTGNVSSTSSSTSPLTAATNLYPVHANSKRRLERRLPQETVHELVEQLLERGERLC